LRVDKVIAMKTGAVFWAHLVCP